MPGLRPYQTKGPQVNDDETTQTFDARSEANIATLLPDAQAAARKFLEELLETLPADTTAKIISGSRTFEEQNALYSQGRTAPGPIVTRARGGQSNHNYQIAWDVGLFTSGRYLDDSPLYELVGSVAKAQGLEWGGSWHSIQDKPHIEWRPPWAVGMPENAMLAELQRRHAAGEAIA